MKKSIYSTPLYILLDTNFIFFSIKQKMDLFKSMIDCSSSRFIFCVTDCVLKEIDSLGQKFKAASNFLRQGFILKLRCFHSKKIKYADDCILYYSINNSFFLVATCDKNLQKRIKKYTVSPIVYIKGKRYIVEPEIE